MSFKSYLQALINALLKKSVENVSPSPFLYSEQNVTVSGTRIISPVDGYIRVNTPVASEPLNYLTVVSESVAHQHSAVPGYVNRLDLPVKKGSYVQIDFSGFDAVYIGFVSRVGGGILKVYQWVIESLQGGAICLKTSLKHSLKQCLRTRRATLRLSACQAGAILYKRLQSKLDQLLSRTMGGHVFKRIAIVYKRVLCRLVLLLLTIKTIRGRQLCCQLKKANICIGTYLKTFKVKCQFGLFTIKQANNITMEVCHG